MDSFKFLLFTAQVVHLTFLIFWHKGMCHLVETNQMNQMPTRSGWDERLGYKRIHPNYVQF